MQNFNSIDAQAAKYLLDERTARVRDALVGIFSMNEAKLGRVDKRDSQTPHVPIVLCTASLPRLLNEEQSWVARICRMRNGS